TATRVMWEFNRVYRNLEGALTDAAQFADLLLDPPSVQDVARPVPFAPRDHSVEVRDISFRHSPAQPLLFDRFSLAVAAGAKVGSVGRCGRRTPRCSTARSRKTSASGARTPPTRRADVPPRSRTPRSSSSRCRTAT